MTARFLVRFDDICPTMNWYVWERVEKILRRNEIKPILAVVPDNRDEKLMVSESYPAFWTRVREWSEFGFTIGLHGYQHLFSTQHSGLLKLHARSEFAGLTYDEQLEKLRRSLQIFRENGVEPSVFVAPAHSFDRVTLDALKFLGIINVSDGFFPFARKDRFGIRWLPQQLWHFRHVPFGVWTVCCHLNSWTDQELDRFEASIEEFSPWIADPQQVLKEIDYAPRTWTSILLPEEVYAPLYRTAFQLKQWTQKRLRPV